MVGNSIVYDNVLKGLERFAGDKIPYHSITTDWLNRYEKFLLSEMKTYSTIGIHMRTLRAILNDAKRIGIIKESAYPFGRDKYEVKASEGRKMALSLEQIGQIVRYDDGSDATAKYRDYWLFLYLCKRTEYGKQIVSQLASQLQNEYMVAGRVYQTTDLLS